MGRNYIKAEFIRERRRLIKKMLKEGRKLEGIVKGLRKFALGKYKTSKATVQRDIKEIVQERDNWQKIHNPHQLKEAKDLRDQAVEDLEGLIEEARLKGQFKTAGDLIAKKTRLQGIDKYIKEEAKREKTKLEQKYEHKTAEEISEILFKEFKILAAALQRMAKKKTLGNIIGITVRIIRSEKDKNKKYIITNFAEEKLIIIEQKKVTKDRELYKQKIEEKTVNRSETIQQDIDDLKGIKPKIDYSEIDTNKLKKQEKDVC